MSISNSKQDLRNALKGNYPLLYIVSEDERPVVETIQQFIHSTGEEFKFLSWDYNRYSKNLLSGLNWINVKKVDGKEVNTKIDFQDSMEYLTKSTKNTIQIFFDFHKRLESGDLKTLTKFIRSVKDFTYESIFPFSEDYHMPVYNKTDSSLHKHLIFVSPVLSIPKELESLVHIIHFDNPSRDEVQHILTSYLSSEVLYLDEQVKEKIVESALGLSETEIMLSLQKSYFLNNRKTIAVEDIQNDKIQIIRKKGMLDFLDVDIDRSSIGGFDELFSWLTKRKLLFQETHRKKYNLSYPKGVMLTGVQGCGKSLVAKVIANEFDISLLRLDMGSMFGRYVGESDTNFRNALSIAEKMAPCVLWIDEIEKSLSTNDHSHETTKRILAYFLTWMQENELPVFLVATANNLDTLPPEFLRKGRFDEIWFVDLPNLEERKEIFRLHWKRRNVFISDEDIVKMSEITEGYSGAEIEAIVKESVITSIDTNKDGIDFELVKEEVETIIPLSVINKGKVNAIRDWAAENQVRNVSSAAKNTKNKIGF